ncbi:MAG: NTP transferase domain-containing protein, partial [Candidatus Omnitrophica bacterium]|nr:NTP transferase domain-containing protein [Candidatus Omnitrophota bacterium]
MQIVILAGGKGTRLGQLTRDCPKVLLEIDGKPFLHYQLSQLAQQGFTEVLLCVGHLSQQVEAFVKDGSAWGLKVRYAKESPGHLLGTAGALKQAAILLQREFAVLNGDSYLPIDLQKPVEVFTQKKRVGLMTVFRNDGYLDQSNAIVEDGWVTFYSRGEQSRPDVQWIDYGFRIFSKMALDSIASDTFADLDELYGALIEKRQLAAFIVEEPFHEIGSIQGLH